AADSGKRDGPEVDERVCAEGPVAGDAAIVDDHVVVVVEGATDQGDAAVVGVETLGESQDVAVGGTVAGDELAEGPVGAIVGGDLEDAAQGGLDGAAIGDGGADDAAAPDRAAEVADRAAAKDGDLAGGQLDLSGVDPGVGSGEGLVVIDFDDAGGHVG